MCGIAGIVDLRGRREINRDALVRMTRALAHRGPDGEDFFIEPGAGFGHRRLIVIDPVGGAQPFQTANHNGVLTFNGEIYNYRALGPTIPAQMRTRSDTEVVAEGLAAHGDEFIDALRGMFALAYWDRRERRLLLARDRLGERPLYYANTPDGFFLFASEIGALLASGMVQMELNPEAVADYLHFGFIPDPKTIWRGAFKLSAAHTLVAQHGDCELARYWQPTFAPESISFDGAAEELRARLDKSVALQLVADAPLGAFLSGGVDSASIVGAMAQTGAALKTYTVGFREESYDERANARTVAARFSAAHVDEVIDLDPQSALDEIAIAFGEPFADTSALPSYRVAQMARRHVTVALSGDGGDEVFAGYRRHRFFLGEEAARDLAPAPMRAALFGPLARAYPKLDWAPRPFRLKTTLSALAASSANAYANAMAINLPERMHAVLSADFRKSLGEYDPRAVISAAFDEAGTSDPLARALYADLTVWLPGRMLVKVDRASMAHGLEVRAPMLDHCLVEWAGAIPSSYKLKNGIGKRVLRHSQRLRLPEDLLNRPKRGFAVPIDSWLREKNSGLTSALRRATHLRECGLFDHRSIDKMISAHQSGAANCGQELWSLLMFDRFLATQRFHQDRTNLLGGRVS